MLGRFYKVVIVALLLCNILFAQNSIKIDKVLALKVPTGSRTSLSEVDPMEKVLISDKWIVPANGTSFTFNDTSKSIWKEIHTNDKDWFEDSLLLGGYAYYNYQSDEEKILILEGMSYRTVNVNGVPRIGNVYGFKDDYESWEPPFKYSYIPVKIKKGSNHFLFQCNYGQFRATLHEPKSEVVFNVLDPTIADVFVGEKFEKLGAVVVINASNEVRNNLVIETETSCGEIRRTNVGRIDKVTLRKVQFEFAGVVPDVKGDMEIKVRVYDGDDLLDENVVKTRVLKKEETYRETFISNIDGSLQYFACNESRNTTKEPQALFLALHGANVEGLAHASSYYPKNWGNIVSPTNRRPFGYNWEDTGRLDALEVLSLAKEKYNVDPNRVYLTGHSMGGHGTWHIGVCYPDQFAAIGPSAGWISLWSYRYNGNRKEETSLQEIYKRATKQSDTFTLAENYKQLGIYAIHGLDDKVVRVDQKRQMFDELKKFHNDFDSHEEPDAGHWWDHNDKPGADCVDWTPLFDFFSRHARPTKDRIRTIKFATANPGISSINNWIKIDAQEKQFDFSTIDIVYEEGWNKFIGSTKNIQRLRIEMFDLKEGDTAKVELDGSVIENIVVPEDKYLWLERAENIWQAVEAPSSEVKNANRYGSFKDIIKNNVVFVYGTSGSNEENEWAYNKARYDAETFWYQGNSSVEVIPDSEYDSDKMKDRNVLLYGNSETNSVWSALLEDSPVTIDSDKITIGDKELIGKDLSCFMIRPKKGSDVASVAVIGGTGLEGMKTCDRRPFFLPGFSFPDLTVFTSEISSSKNGGIKAAGFFGLDWSVKNGEFDYAK